MANGVGVYAIDNEKSAQAYTVNKETYEKDGRILFLYMKLENPYIHDGHILEQGASKTEAQAFTDRLKSEGHDGVVVDHAGVKEYVAFEPTQVKHAAANSGEFGLENLGIRYSAKLPRLPGRSNLPEETKYQYVKRRFQDKFNRLDVLQEWIEKNGYKRTKGGVWRLSIESATFTTSQLFDIYKQSKQ